MLHHVRQYSRGWLAVDCISHLDLLQICFWHYDIEVLLEGVMIQTSLIMLRQIPTVPSPNFARIFVQ